MDASYKIQRGIHVHLIQFFMCPEFWVHIKNLLRFDMIDLRMFCYLIKLTLSTAIAPQLEG